jgi:RND family efflux transporter MFP subunit
VVRRTTLLLAAALFASGCGNGVHGGRDAPTHAPAAQDADAVEPERYTHFSAETELFLETPRLVAGEEVRFAAHLTRLADFGPVTTGRLEVLLSGDLLPEERFTAEAPAVAGIFKPIVVPRHAGDRHLTLILDTGQTVLRHELGPVKVWPSAAAAARAAHEGHDHHDEGIAFTKEQQWKVDFAVSEAARGSARASVSGNGVLRAHPDGEALLTAPAAGQVSAAGAFPHVGLAVRRGQILAWLTPRLGGEADYAGLEAAAAKARVAQARAQQETRRAEALFAQGAIAERRLQEARAEEQIAAAELAATTRRLGQYGSSKGGGIPIRAPIGGVVADVRIAAGGYVQEGALLFHVADTRRLWLEVRVPESEAARLGQPGGVWFTVDGEDTGYDYEAGKNAKLIAVGRVVDPVTRSVPVIFEFADAGGKLRLNQAVKARVRTAAEGSEAVLVPAAALQDENGVATVYVQTGGESFERRIVRPSARDGDRVEIRGGLAAGERVVTRGAYLVRLAASRTEASGHGHAH